MPITCCLVNYEGGHMARLLSPVWAIIRGSIGGTTYTANQFHQIIARARTAPVQPNTTPQTDIKTAFTSSENTWDNLTDADQLAWEDYASATPYSGPLGPYTVTGRHMFLAVFALLLYMNNTLAAGLSGVTDPPPTPGFSMLPSFSAGPPQLGVTGIALSATIPIGEDDITMFGQRSIAFTVTRRRFKGPWVSRHNVAVDFLNGVPNSVEFGGMAIGDIGFARIRGIRTDDPHRIAQEVIIRFTAVAGV